MENKSQNIEGVLKWIIVTILCFIIFLIIFITGIMVGQERARYSLQWAENYHHNFGDKSPANARGIFGQVLKVDGNNLIIKGQDNMEKMVRVFDKTVLVNQYGEITLASIGAGDSIVIIGEPDQHGWIEAKFIRVFPLILR